MASFDFESAMAQACGPADGTFASAAAAPAAAAAPTATEQTWSRGVTPPVYYTYAPLPAVEVGTPDATTKRKLRRADARLHRAVRTAWAEPARAEADLRVACSVYADLWDVQGIANTLVAQGDTRRGGARQVAMRADERARLQKAPPGHTAVEAQLQLGWPTSTERYWRGAPVASRARGDYGHAAELYTHLLSQPGLYSLARQQPVHASLVEQKYRPRKLRLRADDDTYAALAGNGM